MPLGDRVLAVAANESNPFADVQEIAVTGRDKGRITHAAGLENVGEPAALIRNAKGEVTAIQLAGGRRERAPASPPPCTAGRSRG